MPRFSVVVPVYRVQEYLAECLGSVLSQSCADFELIAVDDCSPDDCPQLLDQAAERDERVRVVHLPENVGLGRARNAGLLAATGDYVIFLDSDDTLTPGMLAAVDARLRECADPDILVYDYARSYVDGRVERSSSAPVFAKPGPEVFTLADRPDLLDLLMVVWNKAYRRGYIQEQQLSFPPGYYEDTPWTFPALLAAGRLTVLDRVGVHYRQRPKGGNILATATRKHFDVFGQYDRVFGFIDQHPELERWRGTIYTRMVHHLNTVVAKPGRIRPADRREYFRLAAEHCARLRPSGYRGVVGVRPELLSHGRYFTYQGVRVLARTRNTARWAVRQLRAARPALPAAREQAGDRSEGRSEDRECVRS